MKELKEIFKKIESSDPKHRLLLATVIEVEGSSYRLPGARMLIDENGNTLGMISGGCLEIDILERASMLRDNSRPIIFHYDTAKTNNSVFQLNMGCQGVIRVFLEPINKESDFFKFLHLTLFDRKTGILVTVVDSDNKSLVGKRIFYLEEEALYLGENWSDNFEFLRQIVSEFTETKRQTLLISRKLNHENYELFIEKLSPPIKLIIFGAGYDVIPLVEMAHLIGWDTCVIDNRPAFVDKKRFPNADQLLLLRPEEINEQILEGQNLACVIMTHNYEHDKRLLSLALRSDCFYVGVLGPKKRIERLFSEAREYFSADQIQKLYSPMGLDIGAKTPETIALCVLAEIEAVFNRRSAGFLRDRKGSIYARY